MPPLPPAVPWTAEDQARTAQLLDALDAMLTRPNGRMSRTGALLQEAMAEVCNPLLTPDTTRGAVWRPYRDSRKGIRSFFADWLEYAPTPADPGQYIDDWDWLANTQAGQRLANDDERFKRWFVRFLDQRGRWLQSTDSAGTIDQWMSYTGTTDHPFDIDDYEVPEGGFQSFDQFFLRNVKPSLRPLCPCAEDADVVVSPCDGGVFFLTRGELEGSDHALPSKSGDTFQLRRALPGYGGAFLGGPLLDILLWFTDYHHFGAPVAGEVVHVGEYQGSYNYDFDNFDPDDPYAPALPPDSDRVGWYQELGKHKRYVWILRTESLGLVAMIAIGFWGVGSIVSAVSEGDRLEKGQYMGHFAYGGSSIVLAFEPGLGMQFSVGDQPVSDADAPVLMQIKQCLGRRTPPLAW